MGHNRAICKNPNKCGYVLDINWTVFIEFLLGCLLFFRENVFGERLVVFLGLL